MFVVKRRLVYSGGRKAWCYCCGGMMGKYAFFPTSYWELKYRIMQLDSMEEAQRVVDECKAIWKIPTYDYEIAVLDTMKIQVR